MTKSKVYLRYCSLLVCCRENDGTAEVMYQKENCITFMIYFIQAYLIYFIQAYLMVAMSRTAVAVVTM